MLSRFSLPGEADFFAPAMPEFCIVIRTLK
jgi:hypothetical protein